MPTAYLNIRRDRIVLGLSLLAVIFGTIVEVNLDQGFSASTDLTIEYLTWDPEDPVSGGLLQVHGIIRNVGDIVSSDKYVVSVFVDEWWIDGWLTRLTGYQPPVSPRAATGRPEVFHFKVSDYAIFKQGDHQIKAIVTDPTDSNPNNNALVKPLYISSGDYSSDFNIVNYGMCNRIDENSLPVNITENYRYNAEAAISYAYTDVKHVDWQERMSDNNSLRLRLYNPNGALHSEASEGYSALFTRDLNGREITGFAKTLSINKDHPPNGVKGNPSYDPGYLALNKIPGVWRIEVLNENHLLFTKRFIIEDELSRTSSTTAKSETASESTMRTEIPTTHNSDDQLVRGYVAVIGVIVVVGVGSLILARRKRRQSSSSSSLDR
jgi:hypothetical protein